MNAVAASAVAFGAGVVSFGSPCVLPLVPTYLAVLGTSATSKNAAGTGQLPDHRRSNFAATGLFAIGFTAVFTALGATATTLGSLMSTHRMALQQAAGMAAIVFGAAAILIALGRAPVVGRERRWHPRLDRWGPLGPPVLGAAFAFGWSPCIGPVLGSVLAMAATEGHAATGATLLAIYAAGIAAPLLAASLVVDRAASVTRALARHSRSITVAAGLCVVGVGALVVLGELNDVQRWAS
jgi:cytochrome c-type biogenesis protein